MDPVTLILFGATGDLAKRKIYPALYRLFVRGKLPEHFAVIGLGRREWTDESYRANVMQSVHRFSRSLPDDGGRLDRFLQSFRYCVLDIGREEDYLKLLQLVEQREEELRIPQNRLFYLSVGPEYFATIADRIRSSGLGSGSGWKRLVIEKPFGRDLHSARELNRKLSESFAEEEIYRIDHYLGKPVVQRLESLAQASPELRKLWATRRVANVQIAANESVGVEERAGYYDHAGALRDMFQNHMLQLLMMAAAYLPGHGGHGQGRAAKKQVMEALRPLSKEQVRFSVVRGQYAEGRIDGSPVAGYASEPGVAPGSQNETFVAARLQIDNDDWRGVPFYIRTGKRMKEKSTRIVVEFGEPIEQSGSPAQGGTEPNLLVIEIGPGESITLQFHAKETGASGTFAPIVIGEHDDSADSPEAYENLIGDALIGRSTFFAHWDEVELSWMWVQPVLDAFEENLAPLHLYPAGSYGPSASDELPAQEGFRWWFDDPSESESNSKQGEPYAYHTNR